MCTCTCGVVESAKTEAVMSHRLNNILHVHVHVCLVLVVYVMAMMCGPWCPSYHLALRLQQEEQHRAVQSRE